MATPTLIQLTLPDPAATSALAVGLARLARRGDVLALAGELGTGKTFLARAFLRALGERGEVPSPTFTLVQIYEIPDAPPIYHFDLYRLSGPEELREIGLEEALAEGICLIEWPDRLGPYAPDDRLEVRLVHAGGDARRAALIAHGNWRQRLLAFSGGGEWRS